MRKLLIAFISLIVMSNVLELTFAKRIKRNSAAKRDEVKIVPDFLVLNVGNEKESKMGALPSCPATSTQTAENNQALKATSEDLHTIHANKTPIIGKPLSYILKNRDIKPTDKLIEKSKDQPKISAANNNKQMKSDLKKDVLPSLGQEAANFVGAHIIIPPQSVIRSRAYYPFVPIDHMLKFANSFFYKTGIEDDSAENSHMPLEFNGIDVPARRILFRTASLPIAKIYTSHQKLKDLIDFNNAPYKKPTTTEIEMVCPLHGNGQDFLNHMIKGENMHTCICHKGPQKDDK